MKIKKRLLSCVAAMIFMIGGVGVPTANEAGLRFDIHVFAADIVDSGTCGESVSWTLDSEGTLNISGTGRMANYNPDNIPWATNMDNIKKVTISNNVTSIGKHAFLYAINLASITIPDSVSAINAYAFYGCSSLTSIVIPSSVTVINSNTFDGCTSLTNVTIPNSIRSIYDYAFCGCSSLTSVTIPDNVRTIGEHAFRYCTNLTSINIPNRVTSIGFRTFANCESLKSITIPNSVSSIGSCAFIDCKNLESITISDSVKNIASSAFSGTEWLKLKRKENPLVIVNNILIDGITASGNINIPSSVTRISDSAFSGCEKLTGVTIPNGVTIIDKGTFYNCRSLASVTIPNSVTNIGTLAFYECRNLTNVTIPNSVTSISEKAFGYYHDGSYKKVENFKIYCYKDTAGETYAKDNGFNYVLLNSSEKGKFSLTPSSAELKTGDEFTVTFSLDSNPGINAFGAKICFDNDSFELTKCDVTRLFYNEYKNTYSTISTGSLEKQSPFSISWLDSLATDSNGNMYNYANTGTAAVLTFSVKNNAPVGSHSFTITEVDGPYRTTGSKSSPGDEVEVPFDVKNCTVSVSNKTLTLTDSNVTISPTSFVYNDSTQVPTTITVKVGNTTLVKGTDYTVTYPTDSVNIGTYGITVTGKGNYTGSVKKNYTITAKSISGAAITLSQMSYTYDGTAKTPAVTVKDGTKTLTSNTDYTVSYTKNTNAGTATVTVTGKGNYKDTATKTFTISPKSIAGATITLSPTSYIYDGTAKTPTVTVKDGSKTLTSGTDYTVSYSNNINAGTATVTVTGKGNYKDTVSKKFTINPKSISGSTVTLDSTSYIYDGMEKKPAVTVRDGSKTLVNDTDYTVSYSDNVSIGTATVMVAGKNNYTGIAKATFSIIDKTPKFTEGGDNWCFPNSRSNFGSSYYMNDSYWKALLEGLSNTEKAKITKYVKNGKWGGSCYGMASTSILASNGILDPGKYQVGAVFLHDISKPPTDEVKSLINYYFSLQYTDVISQEVSKNFYSSDEKSKLNSLIKCLEDGSPTLLCFYGYFYGEDWGGHAVVAYGIEHGTYSYNKKAYNGKINVYDNNSVNYNDEYCLYFNSSDGSWTIPFYELSTTNGSLLGLITDDLNLINYHGYLNGTANIKTNDYIAILHSAAISGNYKLTKASYNNGSWVTNASSDDDIKVFSSFADNNFDNCDLMFAMKDANSGYVLKTNDPEKLDLTMSYENSLLTVQAGSGTKASFSPDDYVEISGSNTDYCLGMTYNVDYPTDWYTIQVSGNGINKASLEKVNNGWIISADLLKNVKICANNDSDIANTTFSTDYKKALIYEIDKNTIGIKVDTDNNGTYETELKTSGNQTIIPGDVSGDGKLTMKDLSLLQRYINGWDVEIVTSVADVDNSGKINMRDYALIQRKINGWDVELK